MGVDKPLGTPPRIVEGVTFRCYRGNGWIGSNRATEWRSDCGRAVIRTTHNYGGEIVTVDGERLPTKFRHWRTASAAAAKALKAKP